MLSLTHTPEMGFFVKTQWIGHIIKHNFMYKSLLISSIMIGFVLSIALCAVAIPQTINADLQNVTKDLATSTLVQNGHLTICKIDKLSYQVVRTIKGKLTAYTNTVDQTDSTPNFTASGFDLRTLKAGEGVVANNFLPLGTKVRIPDLFDDMILTVQDRGNPAHFNSVNRFDVYFPGGEEGRHEAIKFGKRTATIEIIES